MGDAKIPMLDLSGEIEELWEDLNAAVQGVLRSGRFIMGPNVKAFEEEMAAYLGVKHAIGVSSGTDALMVGLRALGVGSGDEVITSAFTFIATADTISLAGATPVFADIRADDFNLDMDQVEARITPRTKAIVPVHLFGHAVDMDACLALAKKHGLKVLEDAAQALGGEYKGAGLGTIGDAGAFSFFPSKNLGAFGDAGLIATNDDEVAEAARMLRVHGSRRKYHNETIGYNARLDELQAALLRVKLPRLDASNEGRRNAANRYRDLLGDIPNLVLPSEGSDVKHVYHQYTIRIEDGKRDEAHKALAGAGISSMVYYPLGLHQLPVYKDMKCRLPETEKAAAEVLSLPMWPGLKADAQKRVARELRAALE